MKYYASKHIKRIILFIMIFFFFKIVITKAQSLSKSNIHFLSDTTSNFDGLINKFKGKIIYVDIWASWCSPCKHELQVSKDVKGFEEFALKNDIIVLYICGDKNGSKWKSFIMANKLSGYHILENHYINQDFHTTFPSVQRRNGKMKRSFYIPRHMIVDKDGVVVDSLADHQGSASVYAQLNKMLNQTPSK